MMRLFSNKNITPKDTKGNYHGYVELWDYEDDEITQRGIWRNGRLFGYHEWHPDSIYIDAIVETEYYIR